MHNIIAQAGALLIVLVIAGISSLRLTPEDIAGHLPEQSSEKKQNSQLEALLKLQQVLQSNLLIVNILLLYLLATANYDIFQIIAFAFIWLVAVHLLAAAAGVKRRARRLAIDHLSRLIKIAEGMQPALSLLDNSRFLITKRPNSITSKGELLNAINSSKGVLSQDEKQRIRHILAEADSNDARV
ncbi:MAG TPA: hypothetical protein VLF59_04650 [Candidatus Saccharimonadales bacterium]|nr:hypothetical protein [Candidatus Saccharimonadales bacterium]